MMNDNTQKMSRLERTAPEGRNLPSNRIGLVLFAGAAVLVVGYFAFRHAGSAPATLQPESSSAATTASVPRTDVIPNRRVMAPVHSPRSPDNVSLGNPPGPGRTAVASAPVEPAAQPAGPRTAAQDLVARLAQSNFSGGLTPQKADELKRTFKELTEQGPAAVPAIREFLDRFQDIDFDSVGAGSLVGSSSLRTGLLNALSQIGGPEALELSLQTLQKTGDPMEIALLAKGLEKQLPPEQFRPAAIAAASEALALASSGQFDGRNVSSLFEVLQKYGDESVVPILQQAAGKWNYYATLALAGLPDGAGIPALISLAQDPATKKGGNGDFALRPLAQAAMQYPEARAALLEQARLNQIPDSAWPAVAASLAGNNIQYGNQIFGSTAPAVAWTSDQITQRIAMIDQILAVTSGTTGSQALQNARATLLTKTVQH